jgi:hypothetical protein
MKSFLTDNMGLLSEEKSKKIDNKREKLTNPAIASDWRIK